MSDELCDFENDYKLFEVTDSDETVVHNLAENSQLLSVLKSELYSIFDIFCRCF